MMNEPSELCRSLESRYYTDPAIFELEKARGLARTWQFAGHASQVENTGDYFTFDIAGESLFSIKGQDAVIRTFYNVCQHRAHQLMSDEGNTRLIVCPYHAWSYELMGALRSGPNVQAVPGFDRSKICLTEVRTEILLGFIFVNLDPLAKSLEDWFPKVRAEVEAFVPNWAELKPLEWIDRKSVV